MGLKDTFEAWLRKSISRQFSKIGEFEETKFFDEVAEMVATEAHERGFNEKDRHYLLYQIQRRLMPQFVIADHSRVILEDVAFRRFFSQFSDENWTSFERKWNLKEFLKLTRGISGDFAECGVFRGGSAFLMCQEAQVQNKHVHLFDSFQGLSQPQTHEDSHWSEGDLAIDEDTVKTNMSPYTNFSTYAGWIPERFREISTKTFSFVHVDVDLEQPTHDSIEFFFPRLAPGGILLLDDHGSSLCPGAREAALNYFSSRNEDVLDIATGQGLVIKLR